MNQQTILPLVKRIVRQSKTTQLLELADFLGIAVLDGYNLGKNYGLYMYMKKRKVVFINSQLSELHFNIVLAHEIGHALLHPKVNCAFVRNKTYLKYSIYETEADCFGVCLLKELGYLTSDDFCIHSAELTSQDISFLSALAHLI